MKNNCQLLFSQLPPLCSLGRGLWITLFALTTCFNISFFSTFNPLKKVALLTFRFWAHPKLASPFWTSQNTRKSASTVRWERWPTFRIKHRNVSCNYLAKQVMLSTVQHQTLVSHTELCIKLNKSQRNVYYPVEFILIPYLTLSFFLLWVTLLFHCYSYTYTYLVSIDYSHRNAGNYFCNCTSRKASLVPRPSPALGTKLRKAFDWTKSTKAIKWCKVYSSVIGQCYITTICCKLY